MFRVMETDHQLFELFRVKPDWFGELIGRGLPRKCRGRSITYKTAETRSDFVIEPVGAPSGRKEDSPTIVEFQFYFDQSIFERIGLARHLLWREINSEADCLVKSYRTRQVQGVVIFARKSHIPTVETRHPDIEYFLLEDLIQALRKRNPESIVLDILAPLYETAKVLEKTAKKHYDDIVHRKHLSLDERNAAEEVFLSFLIQRFKSKNINFIKKMIAELPPLAKTEVGKELIAQGKVEGKFEGAVENMKKVARNMRKAGADVAEIAVILEVSEKEVRTLLEK